MGFLENLGNTLTGGIFSEPDRGSGTSAATSTQQTTAMNRPSEFDTLFNEFMGEYLGVDPALQNQINALQARIDQETAILPARYARSSNKGKNSQALIDNLEKQKAALQSQMLSTAGPGYKELLQTAYSEEGAADQDYINAITASMTPHANLLGDITDKRMAGEAVGPYATDIDNLLGERIGVSFGGGDTMGFITGAQQRLLSDLLTAQETGLTNIQKTSLDKALAELLPAEKAHELFKPSNAAELSYLQDLRSLTQPMEYARYAATPSVTGSASNSMSQLQENMANAQTYGQQMGNLSQLFDLYQGASGGVSDMMKLFQQ